MVSVGDTRGVGGKSGVGGSAQGRVGGDKWGRWDEEGQLAQNIEHVPKPVVCIEETSFPDWMLPRRLE